MPLDPHDAFMLTLRPSTHGPARKVVRPSTRNPNRAAAAWSSLHDPAASPSKVQRALVDLVSGSNLRRVLRDGCAWDLPPANPAEVLAAERPLHGTSLAIGAAASSGYEHSVAAQAPASLRELVLEEEAAALRGEGVALRAQLRRMQAEQEAEQQEHRRERAELHGEILKLQEGRATGGTSDVPWAELVSTLLELCGSSLHALQRAVEARHAQELLSAQDLAQAQKVALAQAVAQAQVVAQATAAEVQRVAEAVQVRALSTSLRDCEREVTEQARQAAAARGDCGDAGLAAAAGQDLYMAEVSPRHI